MSEHCEKGDVAETGRVFYKKCSLVKPASSSVTIKQVIIICEINHGAVILVKGIDFIVYFVSFRSVLLGMSHQFSIACSYCRV